MLVDILNTIGRQRIFEKEHVIVENQDSLTREDLQTSQAQIQIDNIGIHTPKKVKNHE